MIKLLFKKEKKNELTTTITETEKKTLQNTLYAVYNGIKALRKETAEKVDYEVIEKYAKEKIDDERYKLED